MNRREMLKSAAGGLLMAMSGAALAAEPHQHHDMGGHAGHGINPQAGVIAAASAAIVAGQACLQHCIELLSQGERDLGKCASLSSDMLTACTAIQQLASNRSSHLASMATVAMVICDECEKECRKFEKKHDVCKTAADACALCLLELKKVAA